MQLLPFRQEWVISIHEECVIKLMAKFLLKWPQAGEINHKAKGIKLPGCEPNRETTAVAMHKTAVTWMTPLPVTTGVAIEVLAAGMNGKRQ